MDIGQHALSTVVRRLRTGGAGLDDPAVLRVVRSAFRESLRSARAARLLFAEHAFDAVLFHEKGYTPFGELCDAAVARGVDVVQYYFGQMPNAPVLKRYHVGNRRQHPFSLSQKSWEHVRALPWDRATEEAFLAELRASYEDGAWFGRKFLLQGKHLKTPDDVRRQLGLDPAKPVAVIFSHILWDATFFYGDNLFDDYEQWLVETVKVACRNTAVQWIVKLHPDYAWKMRDLPPGTPPRDVLALQAGIGALPPHVQVVPPDTDITTYSFFPVTDYCITVRGTIGTEAPCFGIPVFTAGTGRYSGLGFTVDASTREEYLANLGRLQEFPRLTPEQTTLALRHAYGLFRLRLWRHASFVTDRTRLGKGGTLEHRTVPALRTIADAERADDLAAFARWVLEHRDEDYLAPH